MGPARGARRGDGRRGLSRRAAQGRRHHAACRAAADDCHVFHAGTALPKAGVVTSGGRVLCVTALGDSVKMAQKRAYEAVDRDPLRRHAVSATTSAPRASAHARAELTAWYIRRVNVRVRDYLTGLQARIVAALEADRRRAVSPRRWSAPEGGGGYARHRGRRTVRARRRQLLARHRRAAAAVGDRRTAPSSPAARFEAMGVSLVLHPRNPYVPDGAHERALLRRGEGRRADRLVVRRRHGPHALLRRSRRTPPTSTATCKRRARAVRRRTSIRGSRRGATSTSSSSTATSRAASAASSSTISPRPDFDTLLRVRARASAITSCRRTCRSSSAAAGHALRRARARLPGLPPRPLRRVQPGLRPRHAVRPAVGRPHRIDPDVAAAGREVALRLAARSRARPRRELYEVFLVPRDWV